MCVTHALLVLLGVFSDHRGFQVVLELLGGFGGSQRLGFVIGLGHEALEGVHLAGDPDGVQ